VSAPRRGARQAEALRQRLGLTYDQIVGLRFAVNVFIATTIVWATFVRIGDSSPIWAIASMVAASDPEPLEARRMFRSRIINVLVGCALGLLFLVVGHRNDWMLPVALAVSVLVSTWVVKVKTMWRQAPITAAIIIASGLTSSSISIGIERGVGKVAQVLFGCIVGLVVSWVMAHVWLIRPAPAEGDAAN
jgi:uncharacterized membrane protein YccC